MVQGRSGWDARARVMELNEVESSGVKWNERQGREWRAAG